MNTLSYKTKSANASTVNHEWYIVDADGQTVGRICSKIASILRGKHKPSYTPHVDCGDNVIVINAEKAHFSGSKWSQKEYITFSGYPSGQKRMIAQDMVTHKPLEIIEHAVRGMLPKSKLGRAMFRKLFVYAGTEHPHEAQKPQTLKLQ